MKKFLFAILILTPSLFCMEGSNSSVSCESCEDLIELTPSESDFSKSILTNLKKNNRSLFSMDTYHGTVISALINRNKNTKKAVNFTDESAALTFFDQQQEYESSQITKLSEQLKIATGAIKDNYQEYTKYTENLTQKIQEKENEINTLRFDHFAEIQKIEEEKESALVKLQNQLDVVINQKQNLATQIKNKEQEIKNARKDGLAAGMVRTGGFLTLVAGLYCLFTKTSFFDKITDLFWSKFGITNS